MSTLICRNITKTYGKKEVLKSTDLTIEQGKIYGLIGRNGAGKTTLLSIMSAQNPATSGEVTLDGMPVWENQQALDHICFSREIMPVCGMGQNRYKIADYLRNGSIFYPNWDAELADRLVKIFELNKKDRIYKLSKGMMSMLTIIIALASKSDITFLDEPVAGLDVVARDEFYKLLLEEYSESGRTFIVSTHIIEEAAKLFEETLIMKDGCIISKENTEELLARAYHVSGDADKVDSFIAGKDHYREETLCGSKSATVVLKEGENLEEAESIKTEHINLHDLFLALCGEEEKI